MHRKASIILTETAVKAKRRLIFRNKLVKEFLAETFCTFLLVTCALGAGAQYSLSEKNSFNTFLSINMAVSTAITIGVLVGGKISGAHMNPAVSLAMLLSRKLGLIRFGIYVIAQCIGAFMGSALVFLSYYDNFNEFDGGVRQVLGPKATAGIFATYRSNNVNNAGALLDQIVGTSLLVGLILAITDKHNEEMEHGFKAIMIGNAILAIGLSFGMNAGYPINPARDLMPRIFSSIAGWGSEVFTAYDYYFWVPIVGPFIGSILAVVLYGLFMGLHLNDDNL